MAGIRKKPLPSGKYQGWFRNWQRKREYFLGTTISKETLRMARQLEDHHRRIIVGDLPPPKASNVPRPFAEVAAEYLARGEAHGGHGGRSWSPVHIAVRTRHLTKFWPERLKLTTLADVTLPKAEAVVRELLKMKAGKTVQAHIESLKALYKWAKGRGYVECDPLEGLGPVDTTPREPRRAMTVGEIAKLLAVTSPLRRLVYETAMCTGYRKGELTALTVHDLDVERCMLKLAAKYCKGRKDSRQPIPSNLAQKLADFSKGKPNCSPLLNVDFHIDRLFARDLAAAGIPEIAPDGRLVFHSLRHTYCTLVIESGASLTEAQRLLRHVDPRLTANVYSHARQDRLQSTAEAVGDKVIFSEKCVTGVQRLAAGPEGEIVTAVDSNCLDVVELKAGEGVRTFHLVTFLQSPSDIVDPCHQHDCLANFFRNRIPRRNQSAKLRRQRSRLFFIAFLLGPYWGGLVTGRDASVTRKRPLLDRRFFTKFVGWRRLDVFWPKTVQIPSVLTSL